MAGLTDNAMLYYDTVINISQRIHDHEAAANFRLEKCLVYFKLGEFEKCIDETNFCISEYDTAITGYQRPAIYNRRASALLRLGKSNDALINANSAYEFSVRYHESSELATSCMTIALVYAQ